MPKKKNLKMAGQILVSFVKIGMFTFGGGWSILAQLQKEFVERRRWITEDELLDIASVGRSLPGIMIANISLLFGNRMGGVICGIAAVIGISLPPLVILSILTFFYGAFKDNLYVGRAMVGVRASVVPIIASAAFKLCKSAFRHWHGYVIAIIAFGLSLFAFVSNVAIVLFGAVAGLVLAGRNDHDLA